MIVQRSLRRSKPAYNKKSVILSPSPLARWERARSNRRRRSPQGRGFAGANRVNDQTGLRTKLPPPPEGKNPPQKSSVILSSSKDQTGPRAKLPDPPKRKDPRAKALLTRENARIDPSRPDLSHQSAQSSCPASTPSTASPVQSPHAVSDTPRNKSAYPNYTSPKISRTSPPHAPKTGLLNRPSPQYKAGSLYSSEYRHRNRARYATVKASLILRQAQHDGVFERKSFFNVSHPELVEGSDSPPQQTAAIARREKSPAKKLRHPQPAEGPDWIPHQASGHGQAKISLQQSRKLESNFPPDPVNSVRLP